MKKILALAAALAILALPLASLAEEEPLTSGSQIQIAVTGVQISVNDTVLDFSDLEMDLIETTSPDGAVSMNAQAYVGDRMAFGCEALVEGSRITAAVRGIDGVYLSPALTVDVVKALTPYAEAVRSYAEMFLGGSDSEIISIISENLQAKFMNVLGVLMSHLSRIQPETAVIEGYTFVDGETADLTAQYVTFGPDALQALAADLAAVFGFTVPEDAFAGTSVNIGSAQSQDGRVLSAFSVQKDENTAELDVEVISDGVTPHIVYVKADVNEEVVYEALLSMTITDSSLEYRLSASTADMAEEIIVSGTMEDNAFTGSFAETFLIGEDTIATVGSLYGCTVSLDGADPVRASLEAIDAVDVTTLNLVDVIGLVQSWTQAELGEGFELIKSVPGVAVLLEAAAPAEE